jgi:glyceraldehyde-3-phosphate dehydrogenase/erythrose-4-phosphate dehydrogenase
MNLQSLEIEDILQGHLSVCLPHLCRVIDDSTVSVNGKQIKIVSNRDPLQLPWGEMVSSSTGASPS